MTESERLDETFAPSPSSPAAVRYALRSLLRSHGWSPAESADALLAVTELATNAVEHAGTPFRVTAFVVDGRLVVHVVDRAQRHAAMRDPDWEGIGGVGLRIVDRVTDAWSARSAGDEQDVMFEMRRPQVPRAVAAQNGRPTTA